MKETSKVVYLEKNPPRNGPVVKPGSYSGVVGVCRGILFETLNTQLKELFAQLDDDLFKLAENATSNAQQTLFFDAMRSIRLRQKRIEGDFLGAVESAFSTFWDGGTIPSASPQGTQEEDELSLVEKEALEEELAVTTMVAKADSVFHRELSALAARFRHMRRLDDLETAAMPVSPAMLALAFRDALQCWDAELLARLVVYKGFDRLVLSRMGPAYQEMNRTLAEEGVLPDLRYGVATRPHASDRSGMRSAGVGNQPDVPGAESTAAASGATEGDAVPSLEQIWHYLQQLGAASVLPTLPLPVDPRLPVMSRAGVISTLGRLQHEVVTDEELERMDPALQQEYIRQQLVVALAQEGASGGPVHRVGDAEKQTIDVILALFNHVLDDPNLPDAMRALIGRLQIPVLKAAIADPRFLRDGEHPARRLIDDLAEASIGWRDDGDRSERSLYTQVKKAVDRIVHEFDEDVGLFETVRAEFAAWRAQRERVRRIMEERLAQAATGEERLTVARMKVDALYEALGLDRLPEVVAEILKGPWKKLLTILWLREGESGQNWKRATEIARLMAKYLARDAVGTYEREALLAEIPDIMGGLKKGFAYISLDQKKSATLLNRLQSCFIAALKPRPASTTVPPSDSAAESAPRAADEPQEEPAREPDEFDEKVAAITEGTWIRLLPESDEEDEAPLVCKLVWRSKYTGTMVFVDGQGNKAAQIKEEALAERFRQGRADLLEDAQAPLIDRAIRKMMRVLNAEIVGLRLKMAD